MKRKVYVVGTGGFSAELTQYIDDNNSFIHSEEQLQIEGYFDVTDQNYKKHGFQAPFLGSEFTYDFCSGDEVLVAIGDVSVRKKVISTLESRDVSIAAFVHHSCLVSKTSRIGKGNILCPFVIIGPNTQIGNFNLINYQSAVPHDCSLGDANVLSPNVHLTGYTKIGNGNFFGVSSGTKPSIEIGDNNKIQSGIIVDKNIANSSIVFNMSSVKSMRIYK